MPSIAETLAERGARYGDFTDHASLCQQIQDVMRFDDLTPRSGWARLTSDKRQALTVIADKIARILTGDPDYADNWHDIQGYAKLAEDRCVDKTLPQLDLEGLDLGKLAAVYGEREHRDLGGQPDGGGAPGR